MTDSGLVWLLILAYSEVSYILYLVFQNMCEIYKWRLGCKICFHHLRVLQSGTMIYDRWDFSLCTEVEY